jgi:uncharacterized MAPEG superfamily protein
MAHEECPTQMKDLPLSDPFADADCIERAQTGSIALERPHSPKRSKKIRKDPRTKYFGFTERQWPFLFVLVGNWIFALAFFLGAKLVWHWAPAEWSTAGDKIALAFKCAGFALVPGIVGICTVSAQRLDPKMWVGREAKPNSSLDLNTRFILNTFEQFAAFLVAIVVVALYSPQEEARALPILTTLFLLGRLLFWVGYHNNPYLRAFGFGLTFYPTVAVFIWYVLFLLLGIRVPLF